MAFLGRIQCTRCKSVFTVLPHFILRYRKMQPNVARDALLATHGGLSLELCAVICHLSPMALYRSVCALGQQSLVAVLTRCALLFPVYLLADEKHSRCLTDKTYLPTIVSGRVSGMDYCLRHALNKLPGKLLGLSAPLRKGLRSTLHAVWHRYRQRNSLRVVALGQRLRRFADHITATAGEESSERVRNWF